MSENSKQTVNNVNFDIPLRGSLGLLAAGYKGLMAWRMKQLNIERDQIIIVPPVIQGTVIPVDKLPSKQVKSNTKNEDE